MEQLKKDLTFFDLTMIAIGSVIGSGIFLTPAIIAQSLPSPLWILIAWLLGGLMALTGSLTYAELASLMPQAGGVYVYLARAYGGLFGFLYGWIYFFVVNTGGIAALSIAFSTYFSYFVPLGASGLKITAISGIVFLTIINVIGVKAGAIFSDLFTILKILGIVGLIVVGFVFGSPKTTNFSLLSDQTSGELFVALAIAMVGVIWSCGGWQHVTFAAGEAKNPRRDVALAMIVGAIVITSIYLLTNVAYMLLLSPPEIAASEHVAADAVERVLGSFGGALIALAIFISTFGTAGIYTLTAPRIYFAMARDGIFFQKVAEVHPRYRTPAFAIVFQSTWAIVLILFWGTFENLISYVVFTDAIFFSLTAASIFIFRKRLPKNSSKFCTPGYPITPIVFIIIELWFLFVIVAKKPLESVVGLAFVAVGVPVYYIWRWKSKSLKA